MTNSCIVLLFSYTYLLEVLFMKLATTTSDFMGFGGHKFSMNESIRYIHQSGFRYLDYGFSYGNPGEVFTDNWKEYIADVKETAKKLDMGWVQAHAPMSASPTLPVEEDNKDFIRDNIRCIQCCSELGIDRIVVHAGYKKGLTKDDTFELNRKFYLELLKAAEEYGVNILTENQTQMHHESGVYWSDSAKDMLELINFVDHPLFHACWDIGHANSTRVPQDQSLHTLGDHVLAIHVQDNMGIEHPNFGYTDPHVAPFFGSVNFDMIMNALIEIGYKGAFTLETAVFFLYNNFKVKYAKDNRLTKPFPLDIKLHAEELLYKISRYILEEYDCFEG